jgi:hypothetical protein
VGAAGVYAAVATMIQKHLGELENGLDQENIPILAIAKLCKSLASLDISQLRAIPGA